jgi:hypothetical protein
MEAAAATREDFTLMPPVEPRSVAHVAREEPPARPPRDHREASSAQDGTPATPDAAEPPAGHTEPRVPDSQVRTFRTLQTMYATLGVHGMPNQREVYAQVAEDLGRVLDAPSAKSAATGSKLADGSDLRDRLHDAFDAEPCYGPLEAACVALRVMKPVLDAHHKALGDLTRLLGEARREITRLRDQNRRLAAEANRAGAQLAEKAAEVNDKSDVGHAVARAWREEARQAYENRDHWRHRAETAETERREEEDR